MKENNENDTTHKSEINATMAFTRSLAFIGEQTTSYKLNTMKMKNKKLVFPLLIMGFFLALIVGCKKDNDSIDIIKDIDGNVYHTVIIGTQTWMADNLKTSKYNDGTNIPLITDNHVWDYLTTPAYCWYNNDSATYADTYGALYNWYTVETCKLCPTGWHVPTATEWETLKLYLINNGYGYQGNVYDIAKSLAATSGWKIDSTAGAVGNDQKSNNSTGFSALPSGLRIHGGGTFGNIGEHGYWWLATESPFPPGGDNITIYYFYPEINNNSSFHAIYGMSVRCIKE